ncbi:MAG TPA: mercuric reductase, partial [Candidatus Acidoferrales bacterium]
MKTYNAIVIGSGQAGNPLAHRLADLGWRVALIEKSHLGGTCINTGCTPTKTMVHSAQVAHYARNAAKWGVRAANVSVDMARVVERKNKIVESFRSGQQRRVDDRPSLDLYRAQARFTGAHTLEVNGSTLESQRIFINVGTSPSIPGIDGLDQAGYLTNASIMELAEAPEHLIVIGGGYIGLEFGQMFRRFGSRVTVIHHGDRLLTREDLDVVEEMKKALEGEGIEFLLNASTQRVEHKNGQATLEVDVSGVRRSVTGTHILVATGRGPNTRDLGLDKAGVETDKRGYVTVNARLETNVPGIWALGDVKGGPAFTHISYNDYQIVYANIVEKKNLSIENRYVPYSVLTDP